MAKHPEKPARLGRQLLFQTSLTLWAIQEIRRHPVLAGMLFATMAGLAAFLSLCLLLNQTFIAACDQLMVKTPAISIRRAGPGGWLPMPVEASVGVVHPIPGVLHPRVRVWGMVLSSQGPVTLVGLGDNENAVQLPPGLDRPRQGQAVIGQGVEAAANGDRLLLSGQTQLDLTITGRMPMRSALVAQDLVIVHVDDARAILGLTAQQATDLVLDVFHEQESQALLQDLIDAFPWPVYIATRAELAGRCKQAVTRRSLPALLALGPALAALATLVLAMGVWGHRQRFHFGLLKSLGWRSADILKVQLQRDVLIGLPAMGSGLGAAYLFLYWSGTNWISRAFLSWPGPLPVLYLPVKGLPATAGLVVLFIGIPYLSACLWNGWQAVQADPGVLLQEG
jgi:hypothetical protein